MSRFRDRFRRGEEAAANGLQIYSWSADLEAVPDWLHIEVLDDNTVSEAAIRAALSVDSGGALQFSGPDALDGVAGVADFLVCAVQAEWAQTTQMYSRHAYNDDGGFGGDVAAQRSSLISAQMRYMIAGAPTAPPGGSSDIIRHTRVYPALPSSSGRQYEREAFGTVSSNSSQNNLYDRCQLFPTVYWTGNNVTNAAMFSAINDTTNYSTLNDGRSNAVSSVATLFDPSAYYQAGIRMRAASSTDGGASTAPVFKVSHFDIRGVLHA